MDGFMKIPNDIRYSTELTPTEKMLLGEIGCWADDEGWSTVTSAYLAGVMGFTPRRAKQMIADLAARGWLDVDRQPNSRRLKVTAKELAEGEGNFTVKNISPCGVKEISPSTVKNISPNKDNIIQPTIQPARACEVVEAGAIDETLEALAREFAEGWKENGRLIMHRAKAAEDLWPAVVLDTAQWLYLERSKLDPSATITERDLRLALTSPRCVKRAIKNIKDNGTEPTNRKADINSQAAQEARSRDFLSHFADIAQPQDHRPAGAV